MEAMAGNKFWFSAGPAVLGVLIHMMTGAMAVFVVSAFVGLPVAAKITNSGTIISDMASMVGWATFAIEHMMFGLVLGTLALRAAPVDRPTDAVVDARSAMLSQ